MLVEDPAEFGLQGGGTTQPRLRDRDQRCDGDPEGFLDLAGLGKRRRTSPHRDRLG